MKTISGKFLFCITLLFVSSFAVAAQQPELVVRTGHTGSVFSVYFSPDGKLIASAGDDGTVKLWDLATGQQLRSFAGYGTALAFSPDGKTMQIGPNLWDTASGKELRSLDIDNDDETWFRCMAFSPNGKMIASGSELLITVWDAATGKALGDLQHLDQVMSIAFSPNSKLIASGSGDHTIKLWDSSNGKEIRSWIGDVDGVTSVAFSPDGKLIASGGGDTVKLWDAATGEQLRSFVGHTAMVRWVAFSPDGKMIASANNDQTVKLWDAATGNLLRSFEGRTGEVNSVIFSPDGKVIASGTEDATIALWEVATGKPLAAIKGHTEMLKSVNFSPNGKVIAVGSEGGTIRMWDTATGQQFRSLAGRGFPVTSLAFSPDGSQLASGNEKVIDIWDVATGQRLRVLEGHGDQVNSVAFNPDGKLMVSGSGDSTIKLWQVATGRQLRSLTAHTGFVSSVAFSVDGKMIASGGGDHTIKLWDTVSGSLLRSLQCSVDVHAVAFSPDGKLIVSGTENTIELWELTTGKRLRSIERYPNIVWSVAFSPDGRAIVSGEERETAKLWEAATGKELRTFAGHTSDIRSVAFSPSGKVIASASDDGTVKLWRPDGDKPQATLISLDQDDWVVVTPDGRFDTNKLDEIKGLHWLMPDDPLTPVPIEVFMKDYYEPRLLPRILAGDKFRPVPDLQSLNRVQPVVTVSSVLREGMGDTVSVAVQAAGNKREFHRGGKKVLVSTGVHDFKLFRDGQLVAFRKDGIGLNQKTGTALLRFNDIRLPRREGKNEVEFSAYAFNDDGVKSATARLSYTIPGDLTPVTGVAYLVTIGVNDYESSAWNLKFAVNDATLVNEVLRKQLNSGKVYREVAPLLLTDKQATKKNLQAIFARLAGEKVTNGALVGVDGAELLAKATPEDLLIVTYSGHGYADGKGAFYLFPHDIGSGHERMVTDDLLPRLVSSKDLEGWYRQVDAGDFAMVIDACHSAASIGGDDFKPGPMGSRGLGQLAYDKGMRILAASHANDVALESDKLQQGLLTYALVHDGIGAYQADFKPKDSKITLAEWLAYGVERVPGLADEVKKGQIQTFGRGEESRAEVVRIGEKESSLKNNNAFQTPALFDFTKGKRDVILMK